MKLTDEEQTGGRDAQLSPLAAEGGALVSMEAFKQTDQVLALVKKRRVAMDMEEGFFRDYPDLSGVPPPRAETEAIVARTADNARSFPSWSALLTAACARAYAERRERYLVAEVEKVAEVAIAWREALLRRADERRMAVVRLPLWSRLKFRLLGRV